MNALQNYLIASCTSSLHCICESRAMCASRFTCVRRDVCGVAMMTFRAIVSSKCISFVRKQKNGVVSLWNPLLYGRTEIARQRGIEGIWWEYLWVADAPKTAAWVKFTSRACEEWLHFRIRTKPRELTVAFGASHAAKVCDEQRGIRESARSGWRAGEE